MFHWTIWALAHVEAAEVILGFTQNSVGHPSGAALRAFLKGDGPCFLDGLNLAHVEAAEVLLGLTQSQWAMLPDQLSLQFS